jgi:UV DNA damage endonuclease
VKSRLVLENDDRIYTPSDLLPLCREFHVPLVYDVHHHRCNPDGLSVETASREAEGTWDREPLFHLSSPRDGRKADNPRPHHEYIDPTDFPVCWHDMELTVEVEAKGKELAVSRLLSHLGMSRLVAV